LADEVWLLLETSTALGTVTPFRLADEDAGRPSRVVEADDEKVASFSSSPDSFIR
jgi:hypothetical protein